MKIPAAFNSFMLAVLLGVTTWVGRKSADNAERVAALQTSVEALKEGAARIERGFDDHFIRIERRLDDGVSRREFDLRMLAFEAEQRKADQRLHELDLQLSKLKQNL